MRKKYHEEVKTFVKSELKIMEEYILKSYNLRLDNMKIIVSLDERRTHSWGGGGSKRYVNLALYSREHVFIEVDDGYGYNEDPVIGKTQSNNWRWVAIRTAAHEIAHVVQDTLTENQKSDLFGPFFDDSDHGKVFQHIFKDILVNYRNGKNERIS